MVPLSSAIFGQASSTSRAWDAGYGSHWFDVFGLVFFVNKKTGFVYKWRFPKIGVPQNGWFILENPIKMDDLGENPLFSETPKWRFGLEECPFVFWPPAVCSKHCVAPMLRQNFALCFGFVFVSRDSVWTSRLDNSVGHLRLCGFFWRVNVGSWADWSASHYLGAWQKSASWTSF